MAEEAAHAGPVFITKDGEPRAVLIDISEYRRVFGDSGRSMKNDGPSLVDLLGVPEEEYFEWEPRRLHLRFSEGAS